MIDILVDDGVHCSFSHAMIKKAVHTSCAEARGIRSPSLCVRFAHDAVVRQLNHQWRHQDKVTDVLSFPMQEPDGLNDQEPLGDVILAVPFVQEEAHRLGVPEEVHIYHLVAHSTLHLLGYDHEDDKDAEVMQRLENRIMGRLGLHMPYPEWC